MNCDPTFVACQLDGIRQLMESAQEAAQNPNWFTVYIFPALAVIVPIAVAFLVSRYGRKTTLAAVDKQIEVAAQAEKDRWERQLQDRSDDRDYERKLDVVRRRNDRLADLIARLDGMAFWDVAAATDDDFRKEAMGLSRTVALVRPEFSNAPDLFNTWVDSIPFIFQAQWNHQRGRGSGSADVTFYTWRQQSTSAAEYLLKLGPEDAIDTAKFRSIVAPEVAS